MARLLVHVEGQTEESFVNRVLAPHLQQHGCSRVDARLLGNARQRQRRGGIRPWSVARKEILNHLREDRTCYATTMVDYYGLPKDGSAAWPGRANSEQLPTLVKANAVQDALVADICAALGEEPGRCRFLPFVVMHEFEGLLFSDCGAFGRGIGHAELAQRFQAIRDSFATPEDINDSEVTAPSRRIANIHPAYRKPILGTLAASEIGLLKIRRECPHFDSWLRRLEQLPSDGGQATA